MDRLPRNGNHSVAWKGDNVSYAGAHDRVETSRGKAGGHLCEFCGVAARDWAFNHESAKGPILYGDRPYSPNPNDYIPLCVPCHRKWDAKQEPDRAR